MRIRARFWGSGAVLVLGATLLLLVALPSSAAGGAQHVRWDIIRLTTPGGVLTLNPGGHASAKAPDGTTITLTGVGTFVAPAGGNGGSGAVTGGGTWTTSDGFSGTYQVKELVRFVLANFQSPGLGDNIGVTTQRANGVAVLRIQYSDGAAGVLTIGCHGPGAPAGIFEGIATTKGYKTYYDVQAPGADPDANRTVFHVR
jgi:hypothetical protein